MPYTATSFEAGPNCSCASGGVLSIFTRHVTDAVLPAKSVANPETACFAPSLVRIAEGETNATPDSASDAAEANRNVSVIPAVRVGKWRKLDGTLRRLSLQR